MLDEFQNAILHALEITISGNPTHAASSEQLLINDHKNNINFYVALIKIIVLENLKEPIRISAALILKSNIERNFLDAPVEIQELLKQNIIATAYNSKSLKVGKQVLECFKKMLFKAYPMTWETLDKQLYGELTDPNLNLDKLYFVLKAYVKLAQFNEFTKDEKSTFNQAIPEIMQAVTKLASELLDSNSDQRPVFSAILVKLLCKLFRVNKMSIFCNQPISQFWFDKLFKMVLMNFRTMGSAVKWISRFLVVFFRNFTDVQSRMKEAQKPKKKKPISSELQNEVDFYRNVSFTFIEYAVQIIHSYDPSFDNEKIYTSIGRVFIFIINDDSIMNKYQTVFLEMIKQKVVPLAAFSQSRIKELEDDTVELVKSLDTYYHEDNQRGASLNIITSICSNQTILMEVLTFIYHQVPLINLNDPQQAVNWCYKESLYMITEKLSERIQKMKGSDSIIASLISSQIIPDLQSSFPLIKMRVCSLLKELLVKKLEHPNFQQYFKPITESLCQLLTDSFLPVKASASLALAIFLNVPSMKEMITPHVQTILYLYIDLINQCDLEILVNSLHEVCQIFTEQVAPYIIDLIKSLMTVILRMYEKKIENINENKEEDLDEQLFSILSIFTTLFRLIEIFKETQKLPILMESITPVLEKALQNQEFEDLNELFLIVNLMVFKSENGKIHPVFWSFLEFICLSIMKQENPTPSNNPYLSFLPFSSISYGETGENIFHVMRNFIHKGELQLNEKTSKGISYLELIITTVMYVAREELDMDQQSGLSYFPLGMQAELILELKDRPEVIKHFNMIHVTLVSSVDKFHKTQENIISTNLLANNLGICFAVNFYESLNTLASVGIKNEILAKFWIAKQGSMLTFRTKKASFLGLVTLLQNEHQINLISQSGLTMDQYLKFLLEELLAVNHLYELEQKRCDDDDDEDDYDGNNDLDSEEEDEENENHAKNPDNKKEVGFTEYIDMIGEKADALYNEHMFEVEELDKFEYEFVSDSFNELNHINFFKNCVSGLETKLPGLYQSVFTTLPQDVQTKLLEILK